MPLATAAYFWAGGLAIIYLVVLITAGVMTFRNRHLWLFVFGFFVPLLWLIGAIMRPKPGY